MSKLSTNEIIPVTGTTVTLGESGDTISVPSGATIANSGTATGFMPAVGASGNVLTSDGTNWASQAAGGDPSANCFFAHASSSQSISNGTFTKISLQTEVYDTANVFDNTSNYRFVPPNGEVWVMYGSWMSDFGQSSEKRSICDIYKNGTGYAVGTHNSEAERYATPQAWAMVTGNGSDYYELYVYHTMGSTITLTGTIYSTRFFGWRIR